MNPKNSNKHRFPIEDIRVDMLKYIQSYLPYLNELLGDAIKFENLDGNFIYQYTNSRILETAEIYKTPTGNNQIKFYDNYLQYLWCISYSFIVFYDQLFKKSKNEEFDKTEFRKGLMVFDAGLSLLETYNAEIFFSLPNPTEKEDKLNYISKASRLFLDSFSFVLCHEFGHHFLGHLNSIYVCESSDKYKKDEFIADEFAISIFMDSMKNEFDWNKKCGMITALSSMLFLDNTLKGDNQHPDPDDRIKACLNKLDLNPDDELWNWASYSFIFWSMYYHSPIENNGKKDNAFMDFEYIYEICQGRKYK